MNTYRKVEGSRPVYYSVLDHFGQRSQYISIKIFLHKESFDVLLTKTVYCLRLYGLQIWHIVKQKLSPTRRDLAKLQLCVFYLLHVIICLNSDTFDLLLANPSPIEMTRLLELIGWIKCLEMKGLLEISNIVRIKILWSVFSERLEMVFCCQNCSELSLFEIPNCPSDLKNFPNSPPSASNSKSFSRWLEHFFSHIRSEQL